MNGSDVVSVVDVLAAIGNNAHGNCSNAILHQVPEAETSLFSVHPGEKLVRHSHSKTWDLFYVVSGHGEIRFKSATEEGVVPMPTRAFCAMPPGYEHEPCNLSQVEPFTFILIHAPWTGYDFIKTKSR
jgi:mannose-6-phosphate isomerase-like protein (cupin superfamily)